jgi:thiol-disulfide isomerase/thioredoxin
VSGSPPADRDRRRRGLIGPFTGRQIAFALVAVAAVAAALAVVTSPIAPPAPSVAPPDPRATQYAIGPAGTGLAPGDVPPDLDAVGPEGSPTPAVALDGRPVSLADLRGKVVWVDFWASWCPPCRAETPVLRDLYARHRGDGLELVGVSVQESSADDIARYVETYGIAYPIVADLTGGIFRAWRVYGLPTQFLVDRSGVIRAVVQGPVDAATAESLVAPLLAEGTGGGSGSPPP